MSRLIDLFHAAPLGVVGGMVWPVRAFVSLAVLALTVSPSLWQVLYSAHSPDGEP